MSAATSFLLSLWKQPERFFLTLALLFGSLFVIITPPFAAPDEARHLRRVIDLSQDADFKKSDLPPHVQVIFSLPNEFYLADAEQARKQILQLQEAAQTPTAIANINAESAFNHGAIYNHIVYWPALLPVKLAMWHDYSGLNILYLARAMLCIASALIIAGAIFLTPSFKSHFLLIGLLPTAVFIRGSVSADSMTMAHIMLYVALILRYSAQKTSLMRLQRLTLAGVACLIALSKSLYFPVLLLFFALPKRLFATRKEYYVTLLWSVAFPISLTLLWICVVAKHVGPSLSGDVINSREQIAFIFAQPITFLLTLFKSWLFYLIGWTLSAIHLVTNHRTALAELLSFAQLILLLMLPIGAGSCLSNRFRLFVFLLFLAICALLITYMYVVGTPVGASWVEGVHGRYFTPIFPLLSLALCWRTAPSRYDTAIMPLIIIICVLQQASALNGILTLYY